MATHSSILAWRISRTDEPGGLPSVGSQSPAGLRRLNACVNSCEGHPVAGSVPVVAAKMPSSLLSLYPSRVCVSQLAQDPSTSVKANNALQNKIELYLAKKEKV